MPYRGLAADAFPAVEAKTADYTLVKGDHGKVFTTRGAASGTITFTLPAISELQSGWSAEFFAVGAAGLKVASAADKIVTFNDADADAITFGTTNEIIGAHVKMLFDGTQFLAMIGTEETQTMTVTT